MNEIWLPIKGYEGLYEVSNHGRVKSVARQVRRGRGGLFTVSERVLRFGQNKYSYLHVILSKNNKQKNHTIHHLVASHFIGKIPKGYVVNHKDHNKLNNQVDNLEIITYKENTQHSIQYRKENGIKFHGKYNKRPEIDLGLTVDELNNEQWVDINGFEGIYQISNLGRVKSLFRTRQWKKTTRKVKERTRKPVINNRGYLKVVLYKDRKQETHYIHHLVAEHFIGPRPSHDHVINHIDHNKHNNRVSNLEYCTYQENSIKYQEFSNTK